MPMRKAVAVEVVSPWARTCAMVVAHSARVRTFFQPVLAERYFTLLEGGQLSNARCTISLQSLDTNLTMPLRE
jgi:hypothetical protein